MSMMSPAPIELPHRDVPAPRPVIGIFAFNAARTTRINSSRLRGCATTSGTTR